MTEPANTPMVIGSRYQGTEGREYWIQGRPIGEVGGILNAAKFQPYVAENARVVEFGCGGAFLLERLSAAEKIGVEINSLPREEGTARGLDIRPTLSAIDDGWADVVISNHALEHVTGPFDVLREIHRVLKPGSCAVLRLPLDDWRHYKRVKADDVDGHLYAWTPQHIANLFREASFEPLTVRIEIGAWPPGIGKMLSKPVVARSATRLWGQVRRRRELHVVAKK